MTGTPVERDERTVAVENAGYRWAYFVMVFGVLAIVAVRSFVRHEASWDLLALVIVAGLVPFGFQLLHRVLYRRWLVMAGITLALAALAAIVLVALRQR